MTELTPEETAKFLAPQTRWDRTKIWWKNFSWWWSPKERLLQRNIQAMHQEICDNLTKFGE